ncbi:hypothetical protein Tco_1301343 [Tanacetum coccineum]
METKDTISSCSETKNVQAIKYKMSKAKERCMAYFCSLHSHLQVLSKEDLKGTRIEHGFKRAFMSLFGQDNDTFTSTMLLNVDQLQKHLDKDEFQEDESMAAFWVVNNQFQKFIDSQFTLDYDSQMTDKYFVEYTVIEVKHFRDTLLQNMGDVMKSVAERTHHQRQFGRRVNKRQMQKQETKIDMGKALDADLVFTESRQQHIEQPEIINEGRVDQYTEECQVISPLLDSSPDNQTTEKNLSITQHYFPKGRESAFAKPDHVIASSESRNSSKNMPRFSSNDMVHNYYLEEIKKKTQEKDRNSKSSVMHSTRLQHTTNDHKQKPRSNNQITWSFPVSKSSCVTSNVVPLVDHSRNSSPFSDSKHFVCSTCHKCVFNANHDACINKLLKEVNSRKVKSHKTRNSNKPVDQKSHIQKPGRQIFTGHKFSPNKSSAVYEKISPRSCLRWKPTSRIFDTVSLRWIPIGKSLDSCTGKVDSEPPHDSNVEISKFHECKQTLDLSAGTSNNVQKKQSIDLSAGTSYNVKKENLRVWLLKRMISQKPVFQGIHN